MQARLLLLAGDAHRSLQVHLGQVEALDAFGGRVDELHGLAALQPGRGDLPLGGGLEEARVEVSREVGRAVLLPGFVIRPGDAHARLPGWRDEADSMRWRLVGQAGEGEAGVLEV